MLSHICTVFLCIWEILCCQLLVESFTEKRNYKRRGTRVLIIIISLIFYFCAINIVRNYLWLKQASVFLILSAAMYFLFKERCLKIAAYTLLYQGLGLTADYLSMLIIGGLFPIFYAQAIDSIPVFMLIALIGKMTLLCIILIIKRKTGNQINGMLTDSEWLCFMIVPITTTIGLTAIVVKFDLLNKMIRDSVILSTALIITGMNIFMFYLLNSILKRETIIREEKLFHEKVKNEVEMYQSISENLDKHRKRTHEFKNQLACIRALAENENYQELKHYILKLDHNLKLHTDVVNTNHVIVNAVLNRKYKEAAEKGIAFELKVNDLSLIPISDTDIVIMLSNLINNAMEACASCKQKIIKLKFVIEDNQIILSVKNSHNHMPIERNGKFITGKEDPAEHGMGIQNVIEAVERYGGIYTIDYNQDTFSFIIIISNNMK